MAKTFLTKVSIVLTKVSVPVENGSSIPMMGFSLTEGLKKATRGEGECETIKIP
jgi:hypothetical protein